MTTTHCPGIDYLIVIDFEATCDENPNPHELQVTKETAEIIEFAWVIVDTSTLEVVYQHTQYVKPEATPLTSFCTTLTNITWDELENAGTLKKAIDSLDNYIQSFIIANGKTFCFCTHGAWDLRIQLPREARDKHIELPAYLAHCRMFDLKQEYLKWQTHHPDVALKSHSLGEMCNAFELQVEGPQHSGLNDSLTMVNIIRYFCSFGHADVFVNPIDTNADLNQFKKEQSKVIHLAGLPYDVTQPELEAWFSGQGVRPTVLWMIRTSEKSGVTGFGIFGTHEDAMACLDMNGRTLGDRAIEVSPSSERVVSAASAVLAPFPMTKTRLRPGDWVCPACQFHNFASRRTCFKCNAINPNPIPATPPNFTIGDWMCPNPQCNFHNYASRTQCLRCGSFKPTNPYGPSTPGNIPFRPGDWICPNPNCLFQNFASRTQCMRCGSANPLGYDAYGNPTNDQGGYGSGAGHPSSPAPAPFRPGDWYCPTCNSHNFASRFQCIRCGLSKPPQVAGNAAATANMKPGDWLCRNDMCGYHNFAKRTHCAKCGTPNNGDNSNGY